MSDKEEPKAWTIFLLPVVILLGPLAALYWGWAGAIVWKWFVVTLGAPVLSAAQIGGLGYVLSMIERSGAKAEDAGALIARIILGPPLMLASAWLFKAWFM